MSTKNLKYSRRHFLKTLGAAGAAGAASLTTAFGSSAAADELMAQGSGKTVAMRPFGKTGVNVSILSLGGMFDIPSNQLMLKQALRWGVTYWDTAHSYGGGRSEKGVGKYFAKNPQDRKKIFLVTKSGAWTLNGMSKELDQSLRRMQTDYIDLFFVHGISSISEMDDDVKKWGEKAKSSGKIRFFGFSTHSNMEACLLDAPSLGWIDGIMMTYNYRLMHTDRMRAAVDACAEAGIGLTAMKTQGGGSVKTSTETELQIAGRFVRKGFSDGQAKLKAVWENPQIASICSQMPNLNLLMTNIGAAVNKTHLSKVDQRLLKQYAAETCSDYCTGCTHICQPAVAVDLPIGDVMRYLMYSRSYGDRERARQCFQRLPHRVRQGLATADFTAAEQQCPQQMAIGRLMREALQELA